MFKGINTVLITLATLFCGALTHGSPETELSACTAFMNTTHASARSLQWSGMSDEIKLASAIRRYVIASSRAKGLSNCDIQNELSEIREDGERYLKKDCELLSLCM